MSIPYCVHLFVSGANATAINNNPVLDNVLAKKASRDTTYIVVIILVICSIFLLSLLAFVVYRQLFLKYHMFIPVHNKELKPLHIKEQPPVLLLYARDCDLFMNVMKEFRTILKSSLKCQVCDLGFFLPL